MKKFHIAPPSFTTRPFRVPHFCRIIPFETRGAHSSSYFSLSLHPPFVLSMTRWHFMVGRAFSLIVARLLCCIITSSSSHLSLLKKDSLKISCRMPVKIQHSQTILPRFRARISRHFSSADELVLRDDHRDLNDSGTGEIKKKSSRAERTSSVIRCRLQIAHHQWRPQNVKVIKQPRRSMTFLFVNASHRRDKKRDLDFPPYCSVQAKRKKKTSSRRFSKIKAIIKKYGASIYQKAIDIAVLRMDFVRQRNRVEFKESRRVWIGAKK